MLKPPTEAAFSFLRAAFHLHRGAAMFRTWLLRPAIHLLRRIIMDQTQLAQALTDLKAQGDKAREEIVAKVADLEAAIANAGSTTPEVDAALAALKGTVQGLDDLNHDAPEPGGDTTT
jgi:DNA-directed RNA polymerase specialized sigma24 family protein